MANEEYLNRVIHGDCLEWLIKIESKSIDMILCDLPYGTTACKWDAIIPFDPLWEQYKRVIKENGAIVLTSAEPFTSALVMSNPKMFKYDLIYEKVASTGFLNAKKMPLRAHENILVFYKKLPVYNPQMEKAPLEKVDKRKTINNAKGKDGFVYNNNKALGRVRKKDDGLRYPRSVKTFNNNAEKSVHPTQKPLSLFQYLLLTYTNEGDTVLDNCLGSGTTAVACINTNRNFIGIEKEWDYCEIANKRIEEAKEINS